MLIYSAVTPLLMDDYSYSFSWASGERIRSPLEIVASMRIHRENTNGRVVAHSLVQLMLMLPKAVFNCLNALNTVLIAYLFYRYFREIGANKSAFLLFLGAFLIYNYMIGFGQIFLWLDGSINYSWGVTLMLLFLWPYASDYLGLARKRSPLRAVLFLPLAFAVGAYSENGSIAVLFLAFCLSALTALREKRLSPLSLAGLALCCLGFVFLISAPATQGRGNGASLASIADNLRTILTMSRGVLLPLYVIYALCLTLALPLGIDRRRIVFSLLLLLSGLASLSAFLFALYFVERHFCYTVFVTVLAILLLLAELLRAGRSTLPKLLAAAMGVLFLFNFALGTLDIAHVYLDSCRRQAVIRQALAAGEREVRLEMFSPYTEWSGPHSSDLDADPDVWPNPSVAAYYGFDRVIGYWPGDES